MHINAGSRLVSTETSSGTNYLTADHLGSPRINTGGSGSVTARHDYMPFGEEIGTSQRTTGVGYASDNVREQFTGYERDGESGLDFAEARTYGSNLARFGTPDGLLNSGRPELPQSWNRYSYTQNDPMNFSDPTGLYEWGKSLGGSKSDDEVSEQIRNRRETLGSGLRFFDSDLAEHSLCTPPTILASVSY